MSSYDSSKEDLLQPATIQEATNIIKFLKMSHKQEIAKIKETCLKQGEIIKKLEQNRKKELEYLSNELQKYELNLAFRTESVKKQLAQKDDVIQKQKEIIDELTQKLKVKENYVPEITLQVESNSDSGVAMENEELHNLHKPEQKTETKASRKYSRRFADPISFLRRVDFSPMKYKPCREASKKKEEKKKALAQSAKEDWTLNLCRSDKATSDEDRPSEDILFSDETIEPVIIRPKKMNDSMNNHFSDDGSEDTSEEIFDRVMTRSSIRRSVKANPKYKKISRTKSKMLEQVKVNIVN